MTFLPIVDRELSVAARRAGTYWLRFWAALTMLAIWLLILSNNHNAPARMGQLLLNALGILALAFSLFAGSFLTADCLSEEKREGTLGLLFLTDLKSYDVVFGKLAASSLNAFFGLLATFPVLGLTLLVGGVTGGEFARLMLAFANTLFFSLGIGMFVSAISHEARQAMARAFMLIVFFAGVCPMLWWGQHLAFGSPTPDWLLLPSPVYNYIKAFSTFYRPAEFWQSSAIVFGIGLMGVILAMCLLTRAWRRADAVPASTERKGKTNSARARSFHQRAVFLNANPFHWLAVRDRTGGRFAFKALAVLLPLWAIFFIASCFVSVHPEVPFVIALFSAGGMHLVFKVLIAAEASRRMNQDRRSGALELLLATPISVQAILSGQKRALTRHFAPVLAVLTFINLALCAAILANSETLHMSGEDRGIFSELFVGGTIVLVTDFFALGWVGMWRGLKAARHGRAVVGTVARVLGPCWFAIFLLFFIQPRFRGPGEAAFVFGLWFVLGMVVDLFFGLLARVRLQAEFRELASNFIEK